MVGKRPRAHAVAVAGGGCGSSVIILFRPMMVGMASGMWQVGACVGPAAHSCARAEAAARWGKREKKWGGSRDQCSIFMDIKKEYLRACRP